ncbi:hypothetical protein NHQ30_011366 [Ciborinia camelliae]|nr:hypothetical protein NHQ30_011366 [Ciborinia camelliae]
MREVVKGRTQSSAANATAPQPDLLGLASPSTERLDGSSPPLQVPNVRKSRLCAKALACWRYCKPLYEIVQPYSLTRIEAFLLLRIFCVRHGEGLL